MNSQKASNNKHNQKKAYWEVYKKYSPTHYLMILDEGFSIKYAPLYIHSFRLIAPYKAKYAQYFLKQYHKYEDIDNIPDRIRWCRYHLGLFQKDVAEILGISRAEYLDYETGRTSYYDKEKVDKLATLFQIPVTDLLDDYNLFLYKGQGNQIREYREKLNLTKSEFFTF